MALLKTVLNNVLENTRPNNEEQIKIRKTAVVFAENLKKRLIIKRISADVFLGGSIAKGTIVKKDKYDIDIFVRFSPAYKNKNLSKMLKKFLPGKAQKVHGSRDYFQIKQGNITLEIVPVIRIAKPTEALNVTDLSYFHVNYVLEKIKKNKNIRDEIILAKSFCQANNCYGAESYVKGFSGYSLELLICYYQTLEKFLKAITKDYKAKLIIDDKKFYKKNNVLKELNESKLQSPIILIDPTFKQRNALAGLSLQTFNKFKTTAKEFLKNPSSDFFIKKNIFNEFKMKNENNPIKIIKIKTNKQVGDISGTKSKKFHDFFINQLRKEFVILDSEFEYKDEINEAFSYIVINKKKEESLKGPPIKDLKNYNRFIKVNKNIFEKNGFVYKTISHDLTLKEFIKYFKKNYKKIIKSMSIKKLDLLGQ
jgi:tRNA nucleotidyltransferase (CCA-adding enzyme)